MAIRYRVTLSDEERKMLTKMTKNGKTPAKRFLNARTLLLCDASKNAPNWRVSDVAEALGVTSRAIEHLKKRFVEDGPEVAIGRKQREKSPGGKRHVEVTERRTKVDWVHFIKSMLEGRYPEAIKVILVMDNLNTQSISSFYIAFPPEEAKRLADCLEIHYTPKHGRLAQYRRD